MIQFTDAELIRIKASVEFAYDTNETLKIAEKIGDYLVTPQTKVSQDQFEYAEYDARFENRWKLDRMLDLDKDVDLQKKIKNLCYTFWLSGYGKGYTDSVG